MSYSIMIMCEPEAPGSLDASVNSEMINCGLQVAGGNPYHITVVLPCTGTTGNAAIPGADLLMVPGNAFTYYSSLAWEKAAVAAAGRLKPDLIIIPHTSAGYDYAPRVAAMLDALCITSVTAVEKPCQGPAFRRSGFHGKLDMVYETGNLPAVITVMPGAFSPDRAAQGHGIVETMDINFGMESISNFKFTGNSDNNPELENADVIVSAGRGIGKQENLELVRSMARLFPKSSIAGSRIVCDYGWIDYKYQVGLTGKKVSPILYVACGISGSPQHVAGMKDSGTVVSINRDPGAAIFAYSDICIVEDIEKFIPVFLETASIHNQKK